MIRLLDLTKELVEVRCKTQTDMGRTLDLGAPLSAISVCVFTASSQTAKLEPTKRSGEG